MGFIQNCATFAIFSSFAFPQESELLQPIPAPRPQVIQGEIFEPSYDPAAPKQVPPEPKKSKLRSLKPKHGVLEIELLVDTKGIIEHVTWLSGPDKFSKLAIQWVNGFQFTPAFLGRTAAKSRVFIKLRANSDSRQLQYAINNSRKSKFDEWCSVPEQ